MALPRLKHFGWGREGEGLTADETAFVLGRIEARFGPAAEREVKPPPARRHQARTAAAQGAAIAAVLHHRAL